MVIDARPNGAGEYLRRAWCCLLLMACLSFIAGCARDSSTAADVHLQKASRLLREGKLREARVAVDAAITAEPASRETYESAMALYAMTEHYADAAIVGEQLLKQAELDRLEKKFIDEDWAQAYLGVGDLYWLARDIPSAEGLYKKALALAPDSPQLLNQLGYLYADEGIHLEEALRLTTKAARLAPDSGAIVDSLGWAQYKLGRYEDATGTLRRAVTLAPDEPELRYHLGAVYLKLGRKVDAEVELRKALHLDPGHREASDLLKTLRPTPPSSRSN